MDDMNAYIETTILRSSSTGYCVHTAQRTAEDIRSTPYSPMARLISNSNVGVAHACVADFLILDKS